MTQAEFRLVIGIPTVRRTQDYVRTTTRRLLERGGPALGARARIVVMNAEHPPEAHSAMAAIGREHAEAIRTGALVLTTVPEQGTSGSGDPPASPNVARWQRKQVLHAAALMEMCAPMGSYYLHLEDDVLPAPRYLDRMLDFLDEQERAGGWHGLRFYSSVPTMHGRAIDASRFWGFIGVLFRTADLPQLVAELRRRCDEAPVDNLVGRYLEERRLEVRAFVPSLFEHVGVHSSNPARVQSDRAWRFAGDRTPLHREARLMLHRARVYWRRWVARRWGS